jgi:dTMP kinase
VAFVVAIEGIDGSGKGTQAKLLCDRCNAAGLTTTLLSFPRYDDTTFGKSIGQFLDGKFGKLDEVDPRLVSLLYAGDRFESRNVILAAMDSSDVVVFDRYVASNMAHQGAKLGAAERESLLDWIARIEFQIYELPKPDLVVLFDIPSAFAQQLIALKNKRSYTDKSADLHEADADYLEKVRKVYIQLSQDDASWQAISCCTDGSVKTMEAISDEVWSVVSERIGAAH